MRPYHATEPLPVPKLRAWWWPWLLGLTVAALLTVAGLAVWEWQYITFFARACY